MKKLRILCFLLALVMAVAFAAVGCGTAGKGDAPVIPPPADEIPVTPPIDNPDPADPGKDPTLPAAGVKNIIMMIGDGMGPVHEDAGRAALGGALAWDETAYRTKAMTHSLNSATSGGTNATDSAAAGTALATGMKVNNGILALHPSSGAELETIMDVAKAEGKATGVVTSDDLTGATPAAFSAHGSDRRNFNAIAQSQAASGVDLMMGRKVTDGRDGGIHLNAYESRRALFEGNGYTFVNDLFAAYGAMSASKLLAVFNDVVPQSGGGGNVTTLQYMTIFALEYLSRDEDGFVLMIEGAQIDHRSHEGNLSGMLAELLAFDECARIVLDWAAEKDDTLIILTADHETGGLENNGGSFAYPAKAAPVWGGSEYNHTNVNVNAYAAWGLDGSPFAEYESAGKVDNTDLFKIMNDALGLGAPVNIPPAEKVTISYDLQGGEFAGSPTIADRLAAVGYKYSLAIPNSALIEKAGSEFLGWYLNAEGSGSRILMNTEVTETDAHTLYAKWKGPKYNFYFDDDEDLKYFGTNTLAVAAGVPSLDKANGRMAVTNNGTPSGVQIGITMNIDLPAGAVITFTISGYNTGVSPNHPGTWWFAANTHDWDDAQSGRNTPAGLNTSATGAKQTFTKTVPANTPGIMFGISSREPVFYIYSIEITLP